MSAHGGAQGGIPWGAPATRHSWRGVAADSIRLVVAILRDRQQSARLESYQLIDPFAGRYWLVPRGNAARAERPEPGRTR